MSASSGTSRSSLPSRRSRLRGWPSSPNFADTRWRFPMRALGNLRLISGYLGKSDAFDKAVAAFSFAYADQNESDHAALKRAIRDGKVEAVIEEAK